MDAAESKPPVDLSTLEDHVRRDAGRSSLAIAFLCILSLLAVTMLILWGLNLVPPNADADWKNEGYPGVVIDYGEAGRKGMASDLGGANVPDEGHLQEVAGAAETDPVNDLIQLIDKRDFAEVARGVRGAPGGDIGWDKDRDGPAKGDKKANQRWVIEWGNDTEVGYRKKLDHFGIYIGAVREARLVGAVRGFGNQRPESTVKPPDSWFVHRDRSRTELDRRLLADAGIPVNPTDIVAQFFPRELHAKLAEVETAFSNKNALEIKKTVFGVRPSEGGYEFYVIEQLVN